MSRMKPATAASKRQIDGALKLMRRAPTLVRDAGATKAITKILSAINRASNCIAIAAAGDGCCWTKGNRPIKAAPD